MANERTNEQTNDRDAAAVGALLGSVVADSAAMGLHWIYDTERVSAVGGTAPEFHEPNEADYAGVVGVFAHGGHSIGETTRYGATVQLITRHVAERAGAYNPPTASDDFLKAFGYGGSFAGYVDHPAAGALDVIRARDAEIERSFMALTNVIPFHDLMMIGPIVKGVASQADILNAERSIEAALKQYPGLTVPEEAMKRILKKTAEVHEQYGAPTGVADLQLPVLAPSIPVAVAHILADAPEGELLQAVRAAAHLTHTDEDALLAADFVTLLLRDLLNGGSLDRAIRDHVARLPAALAKAVSSAIDREWDSTVAAANELGMSCALAEGLPLSLVTVLHAESYVDAIRTTILCGGDSCGRGLIVGAIAGAMWGNGTPAGVPADWLSRVQGSDTLASAAQRIVEAVKGRS